MPDLPPVSLDLVGEGACGPECSGFLKRWSEWWDLFTPEPVALVQCAGYYESLRAKSRSMVRQADRRYTYGRFDFNDLRGDVWGINRSREVTSEGPLRGWYLAYPPAEPVRRLCPRHRDEWWGGWDSDGVLRGYCRLVVLNELAVIYVFFSHAEGSTGVLNGLLAKMTERSGARYLSYHTMEAGSPGRQAFKERVGFQPYRLALRTRP